MGFVTMILIIVLFIPILGILSYTAIHPRQLALWGKKWQFKNENLEPSDEVIKYYRVMAIIALIMVVILLVIALIMSVI